MIAFNRWIALSASAGMLLMVGLAGCKTGGKGNACGKASCSTSVACTPLKPACRTPAYDIAPPRPAYEGLPSYRSEPRTMPAIPQESLDKVPAAPAPRDDKATRFPFPLPEPITEAQPLPGTGNPFVTVSQTREWGDAANVARAAGQAESAPEYTEVLTPASHGLSRPWADALGLPSNSPQTVESYRANR